MGTVMKMVAAAVLCGVFLQNAVTGHPMRASCHLPMLNRILLNAVPHVRELQHKYELEGNKPSCERQRGLRLSTFPECNLQGMERLALSLRRLSLTVTVLENMTMDALIRKNLETFLIMQTELSKCEAKNSPEIEACQKHLKKYTKKVSTQCLQDEVLLNLLLTLTEDVGFVLSGNHHGQAVHKGGLPVTPKVRSSKKHKGKRRHKGRKGKAKAARKPTLQ